MIAPHGTRRILVVLGLVAALFVVSVGAVMAATRVGEGITGKTSKVIVKDTGGVFNAQGTVRHFAESGTRTGKFIIDVKDESVSDVNYFGSFFCLTAKGDTLTKGFDGTVSVAGDTKAKVKTKLPKGHLGCDIALTALVLRPGQGGAQAEIIVHKMVLTAGAK
ncbi:MAG: hypothetical protein V3V01_04660 [Acidimicrobiales bacterium]